MDKNAVIKALQTGLSGSINLIEHLQRIHRDSDPMTKDTLEQLKKLLSYSEYVYEEHPSKSHPLYDN